MTSLNGLDSLLFVNGQLIIKYNDGLISLTGLENIDHLSIDSVAITGHQYLSICDITPICDYLENGGPVTISGNASGCDSELEVEAACLVPVEELQKKNAVKIFPNPTSGSIQIERNSLETLKIKITNSAGRLIENYHLTENGQINLSHLPSGFYFLELSNKDEVVIKKVFKE